LKDYVILLHKNTQTKMDQYQSDMKYDPPTAAVSA